MKHLKHFSREKYKPKCALGRMCPTSSFHHVSPVKLHFKLRLGTISGAGLRGRGAHFFSAPQGRMIFILCCLYTCGLGATEQCSCPVSTQCHGLGSLCVNESCIQHETSAVLAFLIQRNLFSTIFICLF